MRRVPNFAYKKWEPRSEIIDHLHNELREA